MPLRHSRTASDKTSTKRCT
uniref:Uncharacterized protein n=1 Tax=Anguilla anguilla TaxID=7936 RepID=A0A0E9X758_ANGAN